MESHGLQQSCYPIEDYRKSIEDSDSSSTVRWTLYHPHSPQEGTGALRCSECLAGDLKQFKVGGA